MKCDGHNRTVLETPSELSNQHLAASYRYLDPVKENRIYQLRRMTPGSSFQYFNPIYLDGSPDAIAKVDFGPNPLKDGDLFSSSLMSATSSP